MKNNKLLRISLLVLVIVVFAYYLVNNQDQFSRIANLTVWQIFLIIVGQSIVIVSNIFILKIILQFMKKRIPFMDAARVTAYSSLINFFGFLQGGVGFRGIYLKKYYDVSVKRYSLVTVAQYAIFFGVAGLLVVSGLMLTSGVAKAVLLLVGLLILATFSWLLLNRLKPAFYVKLQEKLRNVSIIFQAAPLLGLLAATILQLGGAMLANAVELSAIHANVTLGGLLVYTGIAQFSILVALTPGAIGIREAILLVAQGQMHLTTEDIVVASTIDRVVYFVTLGIFTPLALSVKNTVKKAEIDNS